MSFGHHLQETKRKTNWLYFAIMHLKEEKKGKEMEGMETKERYGKKRKRK